MSLLDPGCEGGPYHTIHPVRRWVFYLKNLREYVWEPIRRRLFLARQLRIERDYWKGRCEEYEARVRKFQQGRISNEVTRV